MTRAWPTLLWIDFEDSYIKYQLQDVCITSNIPQIIFRNSVDFTAFDRIETRTDSSYLDPNSKTEIFKFYLSKIFCGLVYAIPISFQKFKISSFNIH